MCIRDRLKIVDETLPEETELYDLAELFKVFGDSTRIRILFVLFEAEVCVCDLAKALNMTQSAISHQLRILKQNKLVKSRREMCIRDRDMGITKGVEIYVRKVAPLGDPVEVTVRGYELSLRKADAEMIVVE